MLRKLLFAALVAKAIAADCPGYVASNIKNSYNGLTANLKLAGRPCNTFGKDLNDLVLKVEYQNENRLHVKIYDAAEHVYQIPTSVLDPPTGSKQYSSGSNNLEFVVISSPFSFAVKRKGSGEVLFDTKGSNLIFQSQYLRLRTSLPQNPNIYGLGEDTDAFRRNTTDYTRTLWSRDSYLVPSGTNLYGNHPIYFEHREKSSQTHGVYLHNSNGMDIKINSTAKDGQYLEYNVIGGVLDLYFLAGPGPQDVARQYSEVVGKPVMMPYWSFGYHQCKYGYQDVMQVAEVVSNYSRAGIPLETMWTDIDYMDRRRVFSLDPQRFPLKKMRELVDYLHKHDQHYIVMVDPAVAYQDYGPFNRGKNAGVFLKRGDGSIFEGVVWPGVTAFPDWFAKSTQSWWTDEFARFFNPETGVDISGLWIDMNEAANFCVYPCTNATQWAIDNKFPPPGRPIRTRWGPLPGFPPDFQSPSKRQIGGSKKGLPGRELIDPPYDIANAGGSLSNHTVFTNLVHENGLVEYDTHNLYGTMMSSTSREALRSRKPASRPFVITRSTFAGAGAKVGKWLGDNGSTWALYKNSISQIMAFAGIYQMPMIGADVCGFALNTTETLCARWAWLGAFYPFYRNHAADDTIFQEFYRWPLVTSAAKAAIATRYRLLDYIYTSLYEQTQTGTPILNPLFFLYPKDSKTLTVDAQFFYGQSVLVSPVTEENSTSVSIYLPNDKFYDFFTHAPVQGKGANIQLNNVAFDQIPVHVRGGSIIPLRVNSASTTKALRREDFELLIAPGKDETASGTLYLDDGDSIVQKATSHIKFSYRKGKLVVSGTFEYQTKNQIAKVTVLGSKSAPKNVQIAGKYGAGETVKLGKNGSWSVSVKQPLTKGWEMSFS